jgi:hypothetical protein
MEIAALTSFLAPVLGSLLGDLADRAKAEFGDAVWAKAQKLWRKLQPKVAEDPEALAAAEKVAAAPEDRDLQADLTYFLKRIVEADPELKGELVRDWKEGPTVITATASGAGAVAIAGQSSGNQVSTRVNVPETPTE